MQRTLPHLILCTLLLAPAPVLAADKEDNGFFFRPHDRVAFLGDSITIQ
jgi:hypothetical protein